MSSSPLISRPRLRLLVSNPWKFDPSGRSSEGILWAEYRWLELMVSIPLGLAFWALLRLIGLTLREEAPNKEATEIPANSILYLYHAESFIYLASRRGWATYNWRMAWLGYHGLGSYLGSVGPYFSGIRCFRFDRKRFLRPMHQILRFLRNNPDGLFAIRTDSGGPYGKIRSTLVELSRETSRPLVASRQSCSHYLKIRGHIIPLPFAKVSTRFSEPVYAHQLEGVSVPEATRVLQESIDRT